VNSGPNPGCEVFDERTDHPTGKTLVVVGERFEMWVAANDGPFRRLGNGVANHSSSGAFSHSTKGETGEGTGYFMIS
jgi:hypothetical protein